MPYTLAMTHNHLGWGLQCLQQQQQQQNTMLIFTSILYALRENSVVWIHIATNLKHRQGDMYSLTMLSIAKM
jgi:hypothetical protein